MNDIEETEVCLKKIESLIRQIDEMKLLCDSCL